MNRHKQAAVLAVVAVLAGWFLSACEPYPVNDPYAVNPYNGNVPMSAPAPASGMSDAQYAELEQQLVDDAMAAAAARVAAAEAERAAAEAERAEAVVQARIDAQATHTAAIAATATAEVRQAEERAARATQTAVDAARAEEERAIRATEMAIEVERHQREMDALATQTAADVAFKQAAATSTAEAVAVQTAAEREAQATATAVWVADQERQISARATADAIAAARAAERAEMALRAEQHAQRRAETWEDVRLYGAIVLLAAVGLFVLVMALVTLTRQSRVITPDGQIIGMSILEAVVGMTVTDPARSTGPVLRLWGRKASVPPTDRPDAQTAQNQRADYIRLMQAAGGSRSPAAGSQPGGGFGPPALTILTPDRAAEVIPDELLQLADAEWKKAQR